MPQTVTDWKRMTEHNPVNLRGANADDYQFPGERQKIYFYNVARIEHHVGRPPNFPRNMVFKACPKDKEWVLCSLSITHPFIEWREDTNNNRFPVYVDGYREAMKVLCPLNPGLDQDWNDPASVHQGGNLCQKGVFWSTNYPPLPEEVAAAHRRLEETYRRRLEELAQIEELDGLAEASKRAGRSGRAAAEHMGQVTGWHRSDLTVKKDLGKIDCGVCGEKIRATAKLCVHCEAPTDEKLQKQWLSEKLGLKAHPAPSTGHKKPVIDPAQVIEFKG